MNDLTPAPSLWLKVSALVARWILRLLLAVWLFLALGWAGLHFWIVPRIGDLRPWLERQATQAVGAPVHIGSLTATSNGLIPSIAFGQVRVLDPQGREALLLPLVRAALSPQSLLRGGVEQLYIENAALAMRRTADGRIWMAGLPLPSSGSGNSAALDWLLDQPALAVRNGHLQWTDAVRAAPPLVLEGVNLALRKHLLTHSVQVDAQMPDAGQAPFTLSGEFREPLLARHPGDWQSWKGQLYGNFPQLDLGYLRQYADGGVASAQGAGALRAWVDVDKGAVTGVTADVQMQGVVVGMDATSPPLAFQTVAGRIGGQHVPGGDEFFTKDLQFATSDGLQWLRGDVRVRRLDAKGKEPAQGEVHADRLDLAVLAAIGQRVPMDAALRKELDALAPHGVIEQLDGQWKGTLDKPASYIFKGQVSQLQLAAQNEVHRHIPGVQGLNADFTITESGGKASLVMDKGVLDAPGYFDEHAIPFDALRADVQWQQQGKVLTVSATNVKFANADAQGELQVKWQSSADPLGSLDLQGSLSRADATRVYRYLPSDMDKDVREYVRAAVQAGSASSVTFKMKGELSRFPYADAKQGDFRIAAAMQDVTFAYVPAYLLPKDGLPWPALQKLYGNFTLDHSTLQVKLQRGNLAGTLIQIGGTEGGLTHLYDNPQLQVTAIGIGSLAEGLRTVNRSPLGGMLDNVLAHASVTGVADYHLKLGFPLMDMKRLSLAGSVVLSGNDLQINPDTPRLQRARGTVAFTDSGFSLSGFTARAVGGDVRVDGGLSLQAPAPGSTRVAPVNLRLQGVATADGLHQAKELGPVAGLAAQATGQTPYSMVIGLRSGVLEWQLDSNLVGMALTLPAPMGKPAEQALAVRVTNTGVRSNGGAVVPGLEQLRLDVGRDITAVYVRDMTGPQARVVRGTLAQGLAADETVPMPDEGVVANLNVGTADVDAWGDVVDRIAADGAGRGSTSGAASAEAMAYAPTALAVRAKVLTVAGRTLHNLVLGGGRDGMNWRANLDATELSGYMEYRQPVGTNPGRVYARLGRLVLGPSSVQEVETLLENQPSTMPALDIEVNDFELRGKKLGRVDMEAVNVGGAGAREWRLNRFNIQTPEAVFTAKGSWALPGSGAGPRQAQEHRRTTLNFTLDINDAGDLLTRFGMPGVVRKGKGKVEGQVAWVGAPLSVDYPSMSGSFNINVESGQFLKADPGIAKLLGVLSLQSLPRRLTLDFRDVFSDGFAFDFFRGDITIGQGIAHTSNLQMKGVAATVLMEGEADIAKETQNLHVVVVPEINAGSASLIVSAVNPLVGLSTFLAQLVLRSPLIHAATQELTIDGTWLDPRVTKLDHH